MISTQKLSISLPKDQCDFIEAYQTSHHYKTRSEVIRQALYLLRQAVLEEHYRAANQEIDPAFDNTVGDGLDNETW